MISAIRVIFEISPIGIVPYLLMALFILSYLCYRRKIVIIELKNIPFSTILQIDLVKVKQNLRVELLTYNFLIILTVMELSINMFGLINQICIFDFNVLFTTKQVNEYNSSSSYFFPENKCSNAALSIALNLENQLFPTVCLFLIVLRRAYLKLPYKKWIQCYSVFILVRFIVFFLFSSFNQTSYQIQILYFPFSLIDFFIYLSCCRSFYRLLKGRSEEARWHSTQSDYRIKRLMAAQFFYGQCFTITCFVLVLINFFTILLQSPLVIVLYYPDFLGIFQPVALSHSTRSIILLLYRINSLVRVSVLVTLVTLLFLGYMLVCIGIVLRIKRKRRKHVHINDWVTRSLMEEYRATFDDSNREFEQRPPFIQAFRSRLVY